MKNIVLAMAMLMSITTQAQEKWTLRQCLEYAMQNNITLRQDKLQELSATEDRKQSQAALLPSLSASTNHTVVLGRTQESLPSATERSAPRFARLTTTAPMASTPHGPYGTATKTIIR